MNLDASTKGAIDRVKASLGTPAEYYQIIRKLNRLPRKRGRPPRRKLLRGGTSRSQSDMIIIPALEAGKVRVEEICDYSGLPQSTVYRRLSHLEAQGLVTKQAWPQEWRLVNDRDKIGKYEFSRLWDLKSTVHSSLQDLKLRLQLNEYLAEEGDEAIRRYLLHHGSIEDFLRKEKEVSKFTRFIEVESRQRTRPYLDRQAEQRRQEQFKRSREYR